MKTPWRVYGISTKLKIIGEQTVQITYDDQKIELKCKSREAAVKVMTEICLLIQEYTDINFSMRRW